MERMFIHVGGMPKGGKTTLIERLLEAYDGFALVARCIRADNLRKAQETRPERSVELRRYRDAGASDAIRYRFPSSDADGEPFFLTHMMEDFSEAVFLEGDRPIPYVDLSVYVAVPCEGDGALLVRTVRDRAREAVEEADALERMLKEPGGVVKLLEQTVGMELGSLVSPGDPMLDSLREELLATVGEARQAPPPEPTEHWAIAKGYEGIERARMVVVNVRRHGQREQAERMLSELKRLRKDDEVFNDVLAPRGKRTPITAMAADLSDPMDPGTTKALARIKRSLKGS